MDVPRALASRHEHRALLRNAVLDDPYNTHNCLPPENYVEIQ